MFIIAEPEIRAPVVTDEIVEYLEYAFSPIGNPTDTTEGLWRRVGYAEIIQALRYLLNQQKEEPFASDVLQSA